MFRSQPLSSLVVFGSQGFFVFGSSKPSIFRCCARVVLARRGKDEAVLMADSLYFEPEIVRALIWDNRERFLCFCPCTCLPSCLFVP